MGKKGGKWVGKKGGKWGRIGGRKRGGNENGKGESRER